MWTAAEWDAWISFRSNEFGKDEELALQLYVMLTAKSWRVFYGPICLPGDPVWTDLSLVLAFLTSARCRAEKTQNNKKEWEEKYLHACANSAIAIPLISRHSFKGPHFDMSKYVWSSDPDDLLMEWDLMLELYDRGRLIDILPCLVGDLTDALKQKAQARIMQKLGISAVSNERPIQASLQSLKAPCVHRVPIVLPSSFPV